ncbi:sugar phosphate nucleotidyltransferase [Jatrophihabitans cynanchi]|uniref:Sugar phosphate nucleotidyltransferase n=1 Tax=Jatrophihabitans cynanchi TaxID=2944128 RepID=A0ABY7JWE9_9ACTN|nr:sugar phosphate nucleotidyltransferase [Jatrophihabitans sp. SB3-54]WAX56025.1 sugar phosphate nucleotidyltransferase [Jatrophihabitans sp. SB3-54]
MILAGGLGTRMWPETKTVPKVLLPVAGRPFAEWQLGWLAAAGVDSVVYCIGHLGSMVSDELGDGSGIGVRIGYVDEGDDLRGTAGALRLAYDRGCLDDSFLVLYGDSWLQVDPAEVLRAAQARAEPALMTVLLNDGRWDASNVVFDGKCVVRYAKGLASPPPQMRWVDYGLLAFRSAVIAERVPTEAVYDLAALCATLATEGLLAGFEVRDRFYEIGSPRGRDELDRMLRGECRGSVNGNH